MSIKLQLPKLVDIKPRLTVIGVGGAGCNAVNNMIAAGLQGVEFVVANTDAQSLAASSAEHRIQLGANLTEGLGAGSRPEIGEAAAEEAIEDIRAHIAGSHMVFIAAGMGGGTGTGAASVIARTAREAGILTVAIVCKPFQFEGQRRMRMADAGVQALRQHVDTLIVIPNQNLFRIANERTTFAEAFVLADQVLYSGVACIVELVLKEGLINLDFADVKTVMSGMGTAMMGTGEATGERRAVLAAEEAIANPLLDDVTLKGAKGLLLSITGGRDLTLYEVDEAASRVRQEVDPDANIIVGATFDDNLGDRLRVSIVASGMGRSEQMMRQASAAPAAAAAPPHAPVHAPVHAPASAPLANAAPTHAGFAPPAPHHHGASVPSHSVQPHAHPIEDMHRRLTEALQPIHAPVQHAPPPAPHAPVHGHQGGHQGGHLDGQPHGHAVPPPPGLAEQVRAHREQWAAPGNVMIEEGLHGFAPATSDLAHGHHETVPSGAGWPQGGGFQPQAPAEFHRSARRMPAVEDFPPLAQQEWHAKQAPEPSGHTSARVPEERKNTGLLGRLGIIGRRSDSQPESSTASEHEARPQVSFGRERR